MSCGHCCFACRPGFGKDMDYDTFFRGTEIAIRRGDYICLGGGEPTLHPRFWKFLRRAIWLEEHVIQSGIKVLVITNGSETKTALKLARMTEDGQMEAVLSRDQRHDEIDPRVVTAFTNLKRMTSYDHKGRELGRHEGIRTNRMITPQGSALANQIYDYAPGTSCCCEDMLVYPDGKLFACGCRKTRFGTVYNPQIPEDFESRECGLDYMKRKQETVRESAAVD